MSKAHNTSKKIFALFDKTCNYLGRLPKVDLIILEGKNVRPSVRTSVRPQKVSWI